MFKNAFLLIGILFIYTSSLSKESDDYIGINLSLYNFFNNADFKELPGIPNCCPRFDYGYDNNIGISFFYRSFLSNEFNLQFDIRYLQLSSKFESKEKETFGSKNGFVEGEFTHYLNAEMDVLSINPSIAYNNYGFNFNFGLGLSYFLNKRYDQREQITQPFDRGTFIDSNGNDTGSRIRNASSGNLNSSRDFAISIVPKISYQLNLNSDKTIFLEPAIGAEFNLFNISKEMNWSSFNVGAGLSLVFKLNNEENFQLLPIDSIKPLPIDSFDLSNNRNLQIKSDFDRAFNPVYINPVDTLVSTIKEINKNPFKKGKTIIEYDTMVIKKRLTIRRSKFRYDTLGIDNNQEYLNINIRDSKNNNLDKININEVIYHNEFPIFNKIFYEKNQINLFSKFIDNKDSSLSYYKIFDLIGARYHLSKNKINLNLIESNGDFSDDTFRLQTLSRYLNENMDINYSDISISYNATNSNSKNSIIEVNTTDLETPYSFTDTVQSISSEQITISTSYSIKDKITYSKLRIFADSNLIYEDNISVTSKEIEFDLKNIIEKVPLTTNYLKFELIVNTKNNKFLTEKIVKYDYNSLEKNSVLGENQEQFKRRTIINFDYNSKELSKKNIETLNKISESIDKNDKVDIIGYTDDIGNPEYNKTLSLQRAYEVSKYIKNGKINVIGAGINKKYQSQNTPESKIYSRTVEIITIKK